ncbi:MAG: AAA family ATPase [Acidimicrobiales bacterium]|nr:AAA family ATPase [Acidimicrobiales bacterium]
MAAKGFDSYQARQVAARETRDTKRHTGVDQLPPVWRKELADAGFPPGLLVADIDRAGLAYRRDHHDRRLYDQDLRRLASDVLGPHGALSQRKVFSKRDVIVAVAPRVFGLPAVELDKATDRVLRDPDAIPLVGVPRACERAYATAHVIATERAIEQAVERGVAHLGAARVTSEVARDAVGRQSAVLGSPLTPGQQAAVLGIATSGRSVELVEGVAGSGKTTVMAAVRDAFEQGGFTVIGTSTSGQAARTLGQEAGIMESRTLASLRWRLEHDRMRLNPSHVLVLDEAGMASDRDIAFLLDQARWAGTKVVMVGDDRQLGAVTVGGALGALVERHGGIVHALHENVRQHDLAERVALSELRAGGVSSAVEFYVSQGRVTTERTRDEALVRLADRWTEDALSGRDAAMFAWRRANVAELNRLARERMVEHGRVAGPELAAGGASYAAGDRIIALAPMAQGQIVTSERGVVAGVDLEARRLIVEMENGRRFWLEQEAVAAKLAHAYATTVHRSQGSTHDIAHVYEDGGGRELAYVAMSRAREETHLYLTADDLQQAQEDLCRSWERERRETWAIDTGTPQPGASELESPVPAALQTLALQAERDAVEVAIPTRIDYQLETATYELQAAERALDTLRNERGRYADGELREAAGELFVAGDRAFQHERTAQNKEYSRSIRRDARRQAGADAERVTAAEERLEKLMVAEERKLTGTLDQAKKKVSDLTDEIGERDRWLGKHPKAPDQLIALTSQVNELRHDNDHERWTVEGELNPRPAPAPTIERSWSRSDDRSVGHDRDEGFGL